MIRIAICDDNEFSGSMLREIVNEYTVSKNSEIVVSFFSSAMALLQDVKERGGYDIYLLDIIMPEINGVEAASILRGMKDEGKIIFVTATQDFAVRSYDVGAFYYLLKPYDAQKLFAVLDKATADLNIDSAFITIKTSDGYKNVAIGDVLYIGLMDRVANYYIKDGTRIKSVMLRSSFSDAVADIMKTGCFGLVNVGTAVNFDNVSALDSTSVLLIDGTQLYPSKGCYPDLRTSWKKYREIKGK